MCGRVTRIEADGALKLTFSPEPVPVLRGFHVRERCMSFHTVLVLVHCPCSIRCRLGPNVSGREHAVVSEQTVGVGETRVGLSVLSIFDNCLVEELHRTAQSLLG